MSVTESAFYVARLLDAAGLSRPFVSASAVAVLGRPPIPDEMSPAQRDLTRGSSGCVWGFRPGKIMPPSEAAVYGRAARSA